MIHHLFPQIPHYHLVEAVSNLFTTFISCHDWYLTSRHVECWLCLDILSLSFLCRQRQLNQSSGNIIVNLRNRALCLSILLAIWWKVWSRITMLVILVMWYTTKLTPTLVALINLSEAMEWDHSKFSSLAYIEWPLQMTLTNIQSRISTLPFFVDFGSTYFGQKENLCS